MPTLFLKYFCLGKGMDQRKKERERIKMLTALSTVSSLGAMIVFDFILAYYGGDWLDAYFETGDHTCRMACISLALASVFFTFCNLVQTALNREGDKD